MTPDLDDLRSLAVAVAPELERAALRVLRHQPGWVEVPNAGAYATASGRHLGVRDYLRAEGTWGGCWPSVIAFVDEPTEGVLLHEAAHLLPAVDPPFDVTGPTTPELLVMQSAAIAASCGPGLPWAGHGVDFCRRALHLYHRSKRLGSTVELADLRFGGWPYSQSPAWVMAERLGDEPQRLAGLAFAEIEAEPVPEAFAELFRRDIEFHERYQGGRDGSGDHVS